MGVGFIKHHEVRAVHGLQIIIGLVLQAHRRVHSVVFVQMAGDFIELAFGDVGDPDRLIAAAFLELNNIIFHQAAHQCSLGIEEGEARADFVDEGK